MRSSEILKIARSKVLDGWTRGALARDKQGNIVNPMGQEACSFCASGAIVCVMKSYFVEADEAPSSPFSYLRSAAGHPHIPTWNDINVKSKEEVLEVFSKAIELAEKDRQ